MNLFSFLLMGHLLGDFLLQTNWMATRKSSNYIALFVHAAIYTASVYAFSLPSGGISLKAAAVIFLTHSFLDKRKFVHFWVRKVNGAAGVLWLEIVSDQCWHMLVLALVAISQTK